MQLKRYVILLLLGNCLAGFCQSGQLTDAARISVLTCGPGEDLYSAFGHSAFRVLDAPQGIDLVYNYGTFDFDAPNFYSNFARGKMVYSLSVSNFTDFLYTYQYEKRWVREQILDLDPTEEYALFNFLQNNSRPGNRDYRYEFLFDNCSTKIPEALKTVLGNKLEFREGHLSTQASFRELIQQNLRTNTWSSFGIDLALGAVIDRKATVRQHMFLPVYVLRQLNNTNLEGKPLVKEERVILDQADRDNGLLFTNSPLFWLGLLLIFTVIITYIDVKNNVRSRWLDFILFLLTGATGLLICFLWFLTDHTATAANFNILWAFPLNLVACYFLFQRHNLPKRFSVYIAILVLLLLIAGVLWIAGVQSFSPLMGVLLFTLAIRYAFLYYYVKTVKLKNT